SFESYSTPNPFSAYSNNYFQSITFENASSLEFPEITPARSVSHWSFNSEVPATALATLILPNEIILHSDDLQPILQRMESAFGEGARSVAVEAFINGQAVSRTYHFTKIRLFKEINNFHPKILYAKRLYEYFITTLPISPNHAAVFLTSSILHPIQGFHVTDFPLWRLGCLLDENWVDEDILNGMAELLYFQ
ncbi:hypothetical protein M405DRAFT_687913, partial [Rhizopogon salebrosus TDB-379]